MTTPSGYDRNAAIDAIGDLYQGALDHHWQAADLLAEALGWDLDEHLGDPPDEPWIREQLGQILIYPFALDRGADMGPCPVCDKEVARILLSGHLTVHRTRGEIS